LKGERFANRSPSFLRLNWRKSKFFAQRFAYGPTKLSGCSYWQLIINFVFPICLKIAKQRFNYLNMLYVSLLRKKANFCFLQLGLFVNTLQKSFFVHMGKASTRKYSIT